MRSRCLLFLLLACLWPVSSSALSVTVGMVGGDIMTPTPMMLGCNPGPGGTTVCSGTNMASMPNGDWTLTSWMMNLDPDPTVFANTVLRNDAATTQTFFLNVVLPIAPPVNSPLRITGSIQGGITDTNGNAKALLSSAAPTAIYSAAIDGTVVRTLLDDPSSVNINAAFQSKSFNPSPGYSDELLLTTAASNIAIFLRFNLSPGDSASFTSVFNVVPEPSTAMLIGAGVLGLLAAARRAKARR